MTITSVRIYLYPEDRQTKLDLNRTHWGFAEWFERRLKPMRSELAGPETKGVNIVNFMYFENCSHAWRLGQWGRRDNSFEFDSLFDVASLCKNEPMSNIERLMVISADIALSAPWPQVVAIGRALKLPLSTEEKATLLPFLQWPRIIYSIGTKN